MNVSSDSSRHDLPPRHGPAIIPIGNVLLDGDIKQHGLLGDQAQHATHALDLRALDVRVVEQL